MSIRLIFFGVSLVPGGSIVAVAVPVLTVGLLRTCGGAAICCTLMICGASGKLAVDIEATGDAAAAEAIGVGDPVGC